MSFTATLMDVEIVMLSEGREGEILYDIIYMQNLKGNDTNELIYKRDTDEQALENELMVASGEELG